MDIAILGAGIVGLTMTNLLALNANLHVILIDSRPVLLEWDEKGYDIRCSAITNATQKIFVELGVWQEIIASRVGIYNEMLVWNKEPQPALHFRAEAANVKQLGHIVENRVVTAALYKKLLNRKNVTIIHTAVDKLLQNKDSVTLSMANAAINCKLVIGADGSNSWLRQQACIDTYGWEYDQHAIVTTVKTQLQHNNIAMQRFTADGSIAFLPLADNNLCSIVWSSDNIACLMQSNEQEFCNKLASEFAFMLGAIELYGVRTSFPLQMLHATKYVLPRIALIGDAAHVVHPLAGQGLNLGLLDAVVLSEILQQALLLNHDIGNLAVLRKYERKRKGHNLSMITLTESLKFIFSSKHNTMVNMRLLGMSLIDHNSMVKNLMIHFATG